MERLQSREKTLPDLPSGFVRGTVDSVLNPIVVETVLVPQPQVIFPLLNPPANIDLNLDRLEEVRQHFRINL